MCSNKDHTIRIVSPPECASGRLPTSFSRRLVPLDSVCGAGRGHFDCVPTLTLTLTPTPILTLALALDCVFFHPDDDICDHLGDGERVTVRLGKRLGVNEVGRPEFSRWATIAFSVSDTQQEAREAALKEEYEIAAERQKRLDEEDRLRLAKQHAKKAIKG